MQASLSIKEIMTTSVISVHPDDTIAIVRDKIIQHKVHHMPVLENGVVVGMISMNDIHKMEHQFTQFNNPEAHVANNQLFNTMLAKEIMSTPVITVNENENVKKVVDIFLENMFHALPVVNQGGELTGIVTTFDLIRHSLDSYSV